MMFCMNRFILFASIFVVICATKESSMNVNVATNSAPIQDNIAAESIISSKLKRGASASSTATVSAADQTAQANSGSGSHSAGVISYSTPNSYQQFYSPNFAGGFSPIIATTSAAQGSTAAATPQIFYVRASQPFIQPSGIGTLKLTYTTNPATTQPQTSIQYAASPSQPKVTYAVSPQTNQAQYQVAYAQQPATAFSYAPTTLALPTYAPPYTTSAYTNNGGPLTAASLQQGQIIPYTNGAGAANGFVFSPAQLQQLFAATQTVQNAVAATASPQNYQQIPAAYTTAAPIIQNFQKLGTTSVVSPTSAAFYSPSAVAHPSFLSSIAASQTYANAQKLVALPAYQQQTQAYKTFVGPSTNQASPYTAAYVQPTAISALKYIPQSQQYYGAPAGKPYSHTLAYAQPNVITASGSSPQAYYLQQTNNNHGSYVANNLAQASNTNVNYAIPQYYPQSNFAKYGYAQVAAPHKLYYASQ